MPSATLYVIGTPLGNLGDLSTRVTAILRSVPAGAPEHARRTRRQARATAAEAAAQTSLDQLNRILGSQSWLSGSAYGLADIAWVVNVERLKLCRIAFDPFPHVAAWHAAIAGRPGYVRAVSDYRG